MYKILSSEELGKLGNLAYDIEVANNQSQRFLNGLANVFSYSDIKYSLESSFTANDSSVSKDSVCHIETPAGNGLLRPCYGTGKSKTVPFFVVERWINNEKNEKVLEKVFEFQLANNGSDCLDGIAIAKSVDHNDLYQIGLSIIYSIINGPQLD